ncbi:YybH family protein [Rufibacter roseus]|uniref:YybH family protein n=1 Tax=Rufibacter roseus TaxID=1567108 RepID=A0ABW2DRT8_9BACT|nr:nuclear transport factor 2 family protein [Rufibacter roseus]
MRYFAFICVMASLAFTSCSKTETAGTEGVNVQQLSQEFISAWNSRNTTKLDTMFAEDAHFLQGEVHYSGRSEVSQKWVRETMGTIEDLRTYSVNSGVSDGIAYDGGTYRVDVLPESNELPRGEGEGNYVLIWKKNDKGAWKITYAQLEGLPVKAKN